jgi:hypothetical protein
MPAPFAETTSRLERRFLTTALVPTIVFLVATASTSLLAFNRLDDALRAWSTLSLSLQVLIALAVASGVWFLAGLIASNWRKIVRLYEGYPYARLYRARARRKKYSLWRYVQCVPGAAYHFHRQQVASSRDAYRRYAPVEFEEDVLPTTLGNILLSAERYGLARYGIDVTLLWPRLYWQLPTDMQTDLEAFKEEHQLPLALSFMAACSTAVASMSMLLAQAPWTWFVAVSAVGVALSMGAYFLALERAEEYGEQLRAAVDLHRGALKSVWSEASTGERQFFERVQTFVETGDRFGTNEITPIEDQVPGAADDSDTPKLPVGIARQILVRLRLSAIVAGIAVLLVASGAMWLKTREVPVVVVRSSIDQFERVDDLAVVEMSPRNVPSGGFDSISTAGNRLALSELPQGTALTLQNSVVQAASGTSRVVVDVSVIPIGAIPGDVSPGDQIGIQLQPCGQLLRARLLAVRQPSGGDGSATVTVSLADAFLSVLSECPGASGALIRP